MAVNRTSSAPWKKIRAIAKHRARAEGLVRCPIQGCGVLLDYEVGRTPRSAEVDHIVPHSHGGSDEWENLRVICRQCNQSKGNRGAPKKVGFHEPIRNSGRW